MIEQIRLFNNLSRSKETLTPVEAGKIRLYSCGPTTYDFVHVGNARAFVVGDMFYRVFLTLGYQVNFVRNFTDVDDKIINKAKELGVDALDHSARFVDECKRDMNSLNMLPPTSTPKVSECIGEIISMVKTLIDKEYAYVVDGEVLYHVPKFNGYGKLSKKDLEQLQHGIRVEVDSHKKHPSDFVLWKPAKEGEPSWDSPWGKGRPGWHIECSAMAKKFLGEQIDLHHGGVDLMFPHHENEIAQSEAANGCSFSSCWCHNEFLNFGSEKMSKSLGNVITIRSFVETYGGEVLRQLLLSVHYRSKMDWTDEAIEKAINDVERIHKFIVNYESAKQDNFNDDTSDDDIVDRLKMTTTIHDMKAELSNDFNIPGAMAHFFSIIRLVNREFLDEQGNYRDKKKLNSQVVKKIDEILGFVKSATGLVHDRPQDLLARLNISKKNISAISSDMNEATIEKLIAERKEARQTKNWGRADEIRKQLQEAGIVLKDNPDGSVSWSYA